MSATQSDIAQLEELENRRYAAMLAADTTALEDLLHAELVYSHSTGGMDTKEMYLAALRDKVTVYQRVHRADQTVRVMDDIGLVFSRVQIDAEHKGAVLHLDNRMLAVWSRDDGEWRLLGIQSGAIPLQAT